MKLENKIKLALREYFNFITAEILLKTKRLLNRTPFIAKPCILVVDDEWSILKLLYTMLSPQYELIVKSSPIHAFNWIHEGNNPTLIICEYQLPHFKSASFIQIIKTSGLYQHIPVIILSHAEKFEEKLNDFPFAVDGIIRKPFDPAHLKKLIQKVLNGNELKDHY